MKSWASDAIFGASRRQSLIRASLAVVILGGVVWVLPVRRAGEDGGHHGAATQVLDPFEKAGVVELKEGQQAPGFTLLTLDGGRASLTDHRDKLVVLNFWATWCAPCRTEMPLLEARYARDRDNGLLILGVNFDEPAPDVRLFGRELGITFPLLLDPGAEVQRLYRIRGYPTTFIVDREGTLVVEHVGLLNEAKLDDYLAQAGMAP